MIRTMGPQRVFSKLTAAANAELDLRECSRLIIDHYITGSTGGYVTLFHRPWSAAECKQKYGVGIVSATRVSNTVTVVTASAHGLVAGDRVGVDVLHTLGATTFDGEFAVASAADATTFTFAQTADDDSADLGTAYLIPETPAATTGGDNLTIKTSNSATSYRAIFAPVTGFGRLALTVGGGTHSVWATGIAGG